MLVIALPVESAGPPVVLELLKNVTDAMLIGSGQYGKGEDFFDAVRTLNNMAIWNELTSLYNRRFLDGSPAGGHCGRRCRAKAAAADFLPVSTIRL